MKHDEFERLAGAHMSSELGTQLRPQTVGVRQLRKRFDYVSPDEDIVGDAKYYSNCKAPSGKMATISEYVFLLEKCDAKRKFLVFGNNSKIPKRWLARYGCLASAVEFYFLEEGRLERLN